EFEAGFTGVVLTFEPGRGFDQPRTRAPAWMTYARAYLLAAPATLAQIVAASIVLQLLGLALPLATKLMVDRVVPHTMTGTMPLFALGAALLLAAQAITTHLRATLLLGLQTRLDVRFVPAFFKHLLALPLRFFEQRSSGDLLLRVASHELIREILTGQTCSLVLDGSLVFGYLTLLFTQDRAFGLLVLCIGALQAIVVLGSARRIGELGREHLTADAASQTYLVETLSSVAAVKASGAEPNVCNRFSQLYYRQLDASLQHGRVSTRVETAMAALQVGAPLAMLWLGTSRVLEGRMSAGTMLALCALGASFLGPLTSLVRGGQRLPKLAMYLERIADVMQAEPERARAARSTPRLTGRIEIRNVGFRYAEDAPWIVRGISLVVEEGQTLALVGPTGCGKTTLLKLMLGLYTAVEGTISYDGIPIEELDLGSLRSQFGVVLQEPSLHSGSIRDNIAFGDAGLPLARLEEAARRAAIDDEIEALPMGYETALTENGGGLSGGQRQRIALARALANEPVILFLDEATSHLDAATERVIERNIRALDCTRVVIAHRLSSIERADRIVVLGDGAVIEQGTHDELVALGGRYREMLGANCASTAEFSPWANSLRTRISAEAAVHEQRDGAILVGRR
ncbi:MAG TPA: peptidase domain-containing ABC transporter, partial [Polyangiaceae bacterium]|nr:peptidase domain-containing ABC transporter [Polyangiaceae bacterium]